MGFAIYQHESAAVIRVSSPPEPPSHLPPDPIPLGYPGAPALGALLHALNLLWSSSLHRVMDMFQCYTLKSSHPAVGFKSRPMIHFEFIFVYGARYSSKFNLSCMWTFDCSSITSLV